jgi:hypothetical protein
MSKLTEKQLIYRLRRYQPLTSDELDSSELKILKRLQSTPMSHNISKPYSISRWLQAGLGVVTLTAVFLGFFFYSPLLHRTSTVPQGTNSASLSATFSYLDQGSYTSSLSAKSFGYVKNKNSAHIPNPLTAYAAEDQYTPTVFAGEKYQGVWQIVQHPLPAGASIPLTADLPNSDQPIFSSVNQQLAFRYKISNSSICDNTYILDVSTGKKQALPGQGFVCAQPISWSPDGKYLVILRNKSGDAQRQNTAIAAPTEITLYDWHQQKYVELSSPPVSAHYVTFSSGVWLNKDEVEVIYSDVDPLIPSFTPPTSKLASLSAFNVTTHTWRTVTLDGGSNSFAFSSNLWMSKVIVNGPNSTSYLVAQPSDMSKPAIPIAHTEGLSEYLLQRNADNTAKAIVLSRWFTAKGASTIPGLGSFNEPPGLVVLDLNGNVRNQFSTKENTTIALLGWYMDNQSVVYQDQIYADGGRNMHTEIHIYNLETGVDTVAK